MAIKGKKKSQSRGSQARRRPAAAPRPGYTGRAPRIPWYKQPWGQVGLAVGLAVVAGLIVAAFAAARSGDADREAQQRQLERYTGGVRAVLQTVEPHAGELAALPLDPAALPKDLAEDVKRWKQGFGEAQGQTFEVPSPPGVENVNQLFVQAIQMYTSAADLYALVPDAGTEKVQERLLAQAAAQRAEAQAIWQTAIALLDERRADLDLTSSRLEPPGVQPPPQMTPGQTSDQATVPAGGDQGQ